MIEKNYTIVPFKEKKIPILVSVPHSGTAFPPELLGHFKTELIANPDDTDFFVHELYNFVSDMGITMIHANYSRWVIDLNRSPKHKPLYTDGRIMTALTPTTDFLGNRLYESEELEPIPPEIDRRIQKYFNPYYKQVQTILDGFVEEFGVAILWDAHSIRRVVPTIQEAPFPDLILGTNDGKSANDQLIQASKKGLNSSEFELSYNAPFKGGNITRHFGKSKNNIHALQLEMCKNLYMDDAELNYHPERAKKMQGILKNTFEQLINTINESTKI